MIIIKNRKKYTSEELFGSFDIFLDVLKNEYGKLNYDNLNILELVKYIYQKILTDEDSIQWLRFSRWLHKEFKFKHSNIIQKDFWLERGWSIKETNNFIFEINSKRSKKGVITKNTIKNDIIFDGTTYIIKYKNVKYSTDIHPLCNECRNKIDIKKTNFNNKKDDFYYQIISCSNKDCKSHTYKKTDKYKSYLPEEIYENKLNELNSIIQKSNRLCINYWLSKGYSEEESIIKISELQKDNSKKVKNRFICSRDNMIKRGFTDEELKNKFLTPSNIQFWINKGFSEDESKVQVNLHQKNASSYIDYDKRLLPSNIEYWINKGYDINDSKNLVKQSQTTFTLEKCIEKYGEVEGIQKYTDRQIKWQKTLNKNGNLKVGYSKTSQDLFYKLLESFDIDDRKYIYFATHNGEYKINKNKEDGGIWLYDYVDLKNKKIIEFNGDMYHANPKKYLSEDHPHPFRKDLTSKVIWEKDNKKLKSATDQGFELLIIWDSEYRWGNKQEVINKCIKFLKDK